MPTDDERREVARKLRECHVGWSSGECYYTIIHALGLPDTSQDDGGHALYAAIAELIDPEPERTCTLIKRIEYLEDVFFDEVKKISYECSICGTANRKDAKYCDECGAKVVDE